ncbi:hypothetical protein [Cohaesibacter sp. ES.047]|uniref:hypothetical protein n=1 Tax=Cohaesibacter sp. ES.047 TaxID=1798205 RepID=UPI000BB8F361|nr:hypothetical protein [Cohaesibacter sp. ES.047]
MKILLYIVAAIAFVIPFFAWMYLVGLANAFGSVNATQTFSSADYFDLGFLAFAAVPWLISIVCVFFASRMP